MASGRNDIEILQINKDDKEKFKALSEKLNVKQTQLFKLILENYIYINNFEVGNDGKFI